ncbi:hypothetical protein SAMN05446935_0329 [Burkholderia sp. YR290]|nr:hypothetical protein SAMN05446935_0329 [Burkholderia sp. YR290]
MATNTNVTIFDASSILIGARDPDSGVVGELRDIGLSTAFKVALTADTKQLKSAKGDLIQSIQLTPTATVSIDLRDITKDNLALGLGGEVVPVSQATGKTKVIASAKVGTYFLLDAVNISNLVLTSGASPLVAGVDYTADPKFGKVQFLTVQAGPVTATYDVTVQQSLSLLTDITSEYFVRIEAFDLAYNRPVVLELYRVKFSPLKEFDLIGTDFDTLSMDGDILADATQPVDSVYGQYGRLMSLV